MPDCSARRPESIAFEQHAMLRSLLEAALAYAMSATAVQRLALFLDAHLAAVNDAVLPALPAEDAAAQQLSSIAKTTGLALADALERYPGGLGLGERIALLGVAALMLIDAERECLASTAWQCLSEAQSKAIAAALEAPPATRESRPYQALQHR